jgi:hypothetical protein
LAYPVLQQLSEGFPMTIRKLTFAIILTVLSFASVAFADPITLNYTGNHFTGFSGGVNPYSTADFVSFSITYASPLLANQAQGSLIEPAILSWSFSDGLNTYTNTTLGARLFDNNSKVGFTDANGVFTNWNFQVSFDTGGQLGTVGMQTCNFDFATSHCHIDSATDPVSGLPSGQSPRNPGTWTIAGATSPVPEPSSMSFLIEGIAGLVLWPRLRRSRGRK